MNPSLTFALRVWCIDRDRVTSQLCRSWPEAARAILETHRYERTSVVELVPCVEAMGVSIPLVSATGSHWSHIDRVRTFGRVEGDTVWCDGGRY